MTSDEIERIHARCVVRMWDDDTDDESRLLLELVCDAMRDLRRTVRRQDRTIDELQKRLVRQAASLERAEYIAEVMHRAAFGGQKGGAA